MERRKFLEAVPTFALLPTLAFSHDWPISCNTYNWSSFYSRDGKEWGKDIDADIKHFSQAGISAIEPNIESVGMGIAFIAVLKKYKILMPSIYVNTLLHKPNEAQASIQTVLDIADLVKSYGTRIIVTNPSPIAWGSTKNKSDAELTGQAMALNDLGARLRTKGMTLAYHTHDMEMKAGAREFHHMLQNTAPRNVSFCYDVHWIYRGSENSNVAVFDVLKMYGHRIMELHIRQSDQGIWKETFSAKGDIDYSRFAAELKQMGIRPHLVIEQCVEATSPNTMGVVEAHKVDLQHVKQVFGR